MSVARTIQINDLTPDELALLFTDMSSSDQARFFATVWRIANWPGPGWCQQSSAIVDNAGSDTREAIRTLASHLPADDLAWIAAAGADA